MTAPLYLRPSVQACAVRDDLVLLDAADDAYLCIPQGAVTLDWRPQTRSFAPSDPGAAAELLDAGLVQLLPAQPWLAEPPNAPTRGLSPAPPPRLDFAGQRALAGAWLDLLRDYRDRRFAEILAKVRRTSPSVLQPTEELEKLAASFLQAMVWAPAPGKCLARSFLLLRALQRSGHDCAWVFGVRTWPFGAHCWLQVGDLALDEAPERLAPYQPICAA